MRMIGLLGGTSWPSTIEYYRYLNSKAAARMGGFHNASLMLRNIDYHPIKSRYGNAWGEIPALLKQELAPLIATNPSCILICNNTLHRAYDAIRETLGTDIPFVHMVEETAHHAREEGMRSILLLGTQDTMENGYYQGRLEAEGLRVIIPDEKVRKQIQAIQIQLAGGDSKPEYVEYFRKLLSGFTGVDGTILGCTELPLVIHEDGNHPMPLLNPLTIQCDKALEIALRQNL
jgi:aspartate racemase